MAKLLDSAKATIVSFDAVFPEPYHLVDDKIAEIKDLLPEVPLFFQPLAHAAPLRESPQGKVRGRSRLDVGWNRMA